MNTVIDWSRKPEPWRRIGLAFCRDLAVICCVPLPPSPPPSQVVDLVAAGSDIRARRKALHIAAHVLAAAAGYANRRSGAVVVSRIEHGRGYPGVTRRLRAVLDRLEAEAAA